MFNPKITPGPWHSSLITKEKDKFYSTKIGPLQISSQSLCCTCRLLSINGIGNIRATEAVPELLQIYKDAKYLIEQLKTIDVGHATTARGVLSLAIDRLEERHCSEKASNPRAETLDPKDGAEPRGIRPESE